MTIVGTDNKIRFTPIGGGREIGANSYLLSCNDRNVLLDCGVHPKKEGAEALPNFSLLPAVPEAVVLSHGHVDHCGALPALMRQFPSVVAYSTNATVSIMDRMLHNSVSVMSTLARERQIDSYPLYTHQDVELSMARTRSMGMGSEFILNSRDGVRVSFHHAGHVLGGGSILLSMNGHNVFYTGDICADDQELMAGRKRMDGSTRVDTLIIESTYGANPEADRVVYEDEVLRFGKAIAEVISRGGTVLIPAFALGRTQEMLNVIARLQETGIVPEVPVHASGLGRAIYEVYDKYQHYLRPGGTLRPLSRFGRIGDVWRQDVLNELLRRPSIIVATSGMMIENTPSAIIAAEMVKNPLHGVFFVGYLDPDTLGYRLLHAKPGDQLSFGLNTPPVEVKLDSIGWFHFSAHAPREALIGVINELNPANVVLVHGDPEAIDWMHEHTGRTRNAYTVAVGETVQIDC